MKKNVDKYFCNIFMLSGSSTFPLCNNIKKSFLPCFLKMYINLHKKGNGADGNGADGIICFYEILLNYFTYLSLVLCMMRHLCGTIVHVIFIQ